MIGQMIGELKPVDYDEVNEEEMENDSDEDTKTQSKTPSKER